MNPIPQLEALTQQVERQRQSQAAYILGIIFVITH